MAANASVAVLSILFITFLFLAFLVSGSEVAFSGLKTKEINFLKTKTDLASRRVVELIEKPRLLFGSLVAARLFLYLGVIIVLNILVFSLFPIAHQIPWIDITIKNIFIAALLLLFCDILPRVWAHQNYLQFALFSSWWIHAIIFPVFQTTGYHMTNFSQWLDKHLSKQTPFSDQSEELENAINLMSDEEATSEEKQILKGIQQFSHILVKQVMRSRLDVTGIEESTDFKSVLNVITEQHYSRFPVYRQNLDEIVGILHTKDLLSHLEEPASFHWKQLLRTPFFVPEQKPIEDLLQEFQEKHVHFAVVVDEFGGTSGIITMEDILEEIIGEIKDEFDEEELINVRIDEYNYLFEGKTMIHDVCRIMQVPLDLFDQARGESESLAGLVLELAERMPKPNETVSYKNYLFTTVDVNRNRIQKIKITLPSTYS